MLAHRANKAAIGPHGIPMDVATNPANQFMFEVDEPPVSDFAAKRLAQVQDAFYKRHYTDNKIPVQTAGDMWSVKLKK